MTRIFKDRVFGDEYDLDDYTTYSHLPNNVKELRNLMFKEIGYFHCYVTYFHPDWPESQSFKVEDMIKEFANNERKNCDNVLWYQEQVFLFQSEIENMC